MTDASFSCWSNNNTDIILLLNEGQTVDRGWSGGVLF